MEKGGQGQVRGQGRGNAASVAASLASLRRRVAAIERGPGQAGPDPAPLTLGVPEIDGMLPGGGLARGALHEILGEVERGRHRGGSALAFAAVLAARRIALSRIALSRAAPRLGRSGQSGPSGGGGGQVLWCLGEQGLYGPGLAAFGLGAEQLILVRGRDDQQRLWAMEEGLKCSALAMVVGEVGRLDLGQSRRLQLAAEASGVTALLLHRKAGQGLQGLGVSAALTRWRITPAPSAETKGGYRGIGAARCRVELLRCKGGRPGEWLLQWNDNAWEAQNGYEQAQPETHALPLAAPVAHGPAIPRLAV